MPPVVENREPPEALGRIVNPVMKALLRSPLAPVFGGRLMVLGLTGRRSGRAIEVPVGQHDVDGVVTVVGGGRWKLNLRGGAPVQVWLNGRRRTGRGELVEDPEETARVMRLLLERQGVENARTLGLVVNGERMPTTDEVRDAIRGHKDLVRIVLDPA